MAPKRKRAARAVCDGTSIRNMAAAAHLQSLKEEAICSICLEYFTEPMVVECGHTFCLSCITQCWEGLQAAFPCPQCRAVAETKTLRPNWQLGNVVEIAKHLQVSTATPQKENLCREHEEQLKLFCEDDQEPICLVCSVSRDHKPHMVLPIQEAVQEYKAMFKSQRERIANEFEKLKEFLEKEQSCYLKDLEQEEKNNLQSIKETLTKLEEQQSVLRSLITDIESKCQQQGVELLKDVKNTLRRYENMKAQHASYDTFKGKEEETEEEEEDDADLQIQIIDSLEWRWARSFAAAVTLDPDTAHWSLVLSEDGRSVRDGDEEQDLPDTPQRYTYYIAVLGRESLSSGRHYWEVEVGDKTAWELGVCDEAASRNGGITLTPEDGFWTVWLRDGKYKALTSSPTLLAPRVPPRAVGLFLDYEAGRLSVYNVDDRSLLFTFSGASFPPTLRPLLSPGLNEGGKNMGALRILPGTGWE
ncbi:E3 ubiquitin-protein ligase TRIM39-like isoform X2 [Lissotriton helveticus]